MATVQNLAFDLGETWLIDLTAYDGDGLTVFDLTSATVALYVKNATTIILAPANQSFSLTAPTSGKARITVTPANTTALPDVARERATAWATSAPPCSSSR